MFGELRHRTHHVGGLIHSSLESAVLTAGALLMLLGLLLFYFGLMFLRG